MPKKPSDTNGKTAGISDAAVQAKTGKTWREWIKLLDADGARKMPHAEIAKLVHEKYGVGPRWRQMVTVGYEQARGLREKHETASGYQVGRSKTLPISVAQLYRAWSDPRARSRWLNDAGFTVRKATPNKSMRITWIDGKSNVEVMFYAKGAGKSQVTVQHNKLPSAKAGEKMKAYWGEKLDRLGESVTAKRPLGALKGKIKVKGDIVSTGLRWDAES